MKNIFLLIIVSFNFAFAQSTVLAKPRPAGEVKRIMTTLDWSDALGHWRRYLQFDTCTKDQCHIQSIFSSDQICPPETENGKWCNDIESSGVVQFQKDGFYFTSDKDSDKGFCQLSFDREWKVWQLRGDACPPEFMSVTASEIN